MELSKITKRQQEIIEAAGKILSVSGVSGLTTKNLAKEMGFTESALYRHFKGKQEIIVSMLEFLASSMEERFSTLIDGQQTPEERFTQLFNTQFTLFSEKPYFVVAVFSDGLIQESELINTAIRKIMMVKFKHLQSIIEQGQEQNKFIKSIQTEQLIHIIMGSFRLLIFKWRMGDFKFDIKAKGSEMIQTLLILIKTQ